ncbi:MAG: DUF4845 domain-containing protein [Gammaproteobacteria bacterium]
MTFIGGLLVALIVAVFGFAGLRLVPVYLEYQKVSGALTQLEADFATGGATESEVRRTLERRFEVDDVTSLTAREVAISRDAGQLEVTAEYTAVAPFLSNISFLVEFERTVRLKAN